MDYIVKAQILTLYCNLNGLTLLLFNILHPVWQYLSHSSYIPLQYVAGWNSGGAQLPETPASHVLVQTLIPQHQQPQPVCRLSYMAAFQQSLARRVCLITHVHTFLGWMILQFVIYSILVLNNKSAPGKETTSVCLLLNLLRSSPIKKENPDL